MISRSAESQAYQKWYRSKRWAAVRKAKLALNPYCECPHHMGKDMSAIATVVDHDVPHKGNPRLFWSRTNLRSMTKACHDSMKQSAERGGAGFRRGVDESGNPLDQTHEWYG